MAKISYKTRSTDSKHYSNRIIINDKSATYNFRVVEILEAGIVLTGQEVKSIQDGGSNMKGGRVYISNNGKEVLLAGLHVTPFATYTSDMYHDMDREKKLLLHKKEIKKMQEWEKVTGQALVPLRIKLASNGKIKVDIGLCVGLKKYDKREKEKKATANRDIERALGRK